MKRGLFFLLFMVAFVFKGFSQSTPADSTEMYAYIDSVLAETRGPIKRTDFFNLMTTFNAYVDINASGGTGKLNTSDTASMLASYTRYVEFLDSISDLRFDLGAGAVQPSDTAAMLTPYISRSDTAAMLAPYSKFDGAYSSLTGKPQHEQLKTTTYITNNYTIQSSDSNKVFINNTTSNYTITINHNATTSWSKQQIEFRAPNTGYIRILVTNGTLTDGEANVLTADTIFIGGFVYLTSGTNWTIVNGSVSSNGGGTYSAGFGLDLATNVFSVDTTASGVATQFDIDSILSTKFYLTSEVDGSTTNEIQDLSLSGNTLSLTSDATTVDLSSYLDNTDDQVATEVGITDAGAFYSGKTVEIALQDLGTAVDSTWNSIKINSMASGTSDTITINDNLSVIGSGIFDGNLSISAGDSLYLDGDGGNDYFRLNGSIMEQWVGGVKKSEVGTNFNVNTNLNVTGAVGITNGTITLSSNYDLQWQGGNNRIEGQSGGVGGGGIDIYTGGSMQAEFDPTSNGLITLHDDVTIDSALVVTGVSTFNDSTSGISYTDLSDIPNLDSLLISQSSRELNQNDTLKTTDFGKVLYNDDATNDTLYIPTALTPYKGSRFVGVESYGDGSVVIIEMSGVALTDIENIAVDTTIIRATAIRSLGSNSYKILSKTTGEFGWAHYVDTAYATAADSFYVAQGSTATLPIKADMTASLSTSYLPFNIDSLWSQHNSKIIGVSTGASYTVRVNFKAKNSSNTGYATLALDIGTGGTPNIVTSESLVFPKGSGVETQESKTILLYSLDTFIANGCAIKITADTGNLEIYDISLMIRLDYTP